MRVSRSGRVLALSACMALGFGAASCNGSTSPGVDKTTPSATVTVAAASVEIGELPTQSLEPSGHLLLTKSRLAEVKRRVESGDPAWKRLLTNVSEWVGKPRGDRTTIENIATVYLLTQDPKFARTAYDWTLDLMAKEDVQNGSYLYFGDIMRPVAYVLNYCGTALSAAEKKKLSDYMDKWTDELWNHNKGSGWGLSDPGNNYHMAFLEGTAFVGYALRAAGDPRGQKWIDLLIDRLDRKDGVMQYLATRGVGGDWHEGANYGQRTKQRLFQALSLVASMDGKNYFPTQTFFRDSIYYAIYQSQPGFKVQYPSGDLARDVMSPLSAYDRDYIQMAVFWLHDPNARAVGQWFLNNVVSDYDHPTFSWRAGYHKELLFGLSLPEKPASSLPPFYVAEGTGWINVRSGWDDGATSLSIAAPAVIDQSHAHLDAASFTLFKRDWLAIDAVTYSQSGLLQGAEAHNGISVRNTERRDGKVGGLRYVEDLPEIFHASIDASSQFKRRTDGDTAPLLDKWIRDIAYLKPNTVVVYDRVAAKSGEVFELRTHFKGRPRSSGSLFQTENGGGGISLQLLIGKGAKVVSNEDIESASFRVQADADAGRLLSILRVADGAAPALAASHVRAGKGAEGAVTDDLVVLFPTDAQQPLNFPLRYQIQGEQRRTHVILGAGSNCDAAITRLGGKTVVEIKPGFTHQRTEHGLITFVQ